MPDNLSKLHLFFSSRENGGKLFAAKTFFPFTKTSKKKKKSESDFFLKILLQKKKSFAVVFFPMNKKIL